MIQSLVKHSPKAIITPIAMLLMLIFAVGSAHAFTTEETITVNKLATTSNLTETQTIALFDLLQDSNETQLIEDLESDVEDDFEDFEERFEDNLTLLDNRFEDLEDNLSETVIQLTEKIEDLEVEESEVAVIEKQIELVKEIQATQTGTSKDPFEELLETLISGEIPSEEDSSNEEVDDETLDEKIQNEFNQRDFISESDFERWKEDNEWKDWLLYALTAVVVFLLYINFGKSPEEEPPHTPVKKAQPTNPYLEDEN